MLLLGESVHCSNDETKQDRDSARSEKSSRGGRTPQRRNSADAATSQHRHQHNRLLSWCCVSQPRAVAAGSGERALGGKACHRAAAPSTTQRSRQASLPRSLILPSPLRSSLDTITCLKESAGAPKSRNTEDGQNVSDSSTCGARTHTTCTAVLQWSHGTASGPICLSQRAIPCLPMRHAALSANVIAMVTMMLAVQSARKAGNPTEQGR